MFSIVRTAAGRVLIALAICAGATITFLLTAGSASACSYAIQDGGAHPTACGYGGGQPPQITVEPADTTGYVDGTVQFTADAASYDSVLWEYSSDNGATWNGAGQYSTTYTLGSLAPSEDGNLVRADFTNGNGTSTTAAARLTVLPAQPVATPSPASLSFVPEQVGFAAPEQSLTVTNTGTRVLGFGDAYDSSDSFFIDTDACSERLLAPGDSCSLSILFVPSHEGPISGGLVLPDNATPTNAPSQLLVDLAGYGGEPATLGADTTTDGVVGTPVTYALSLGGDPAPAVSLSSGALPPGLSLVNTGTVTGTPTTAGTYVATVEADNGVGSPAYQTLTFVIANRVGLTMPSASVIEGDHRTTWLTFTYQLAHPSTIATSFHYATKNGTATAGSDYVRTSGTITIPAGTQIGQLTVVVKGDTTVEPDEQFTVNLSQPVGLVLHTHAAVGTIVNDD